MADDFTELSVKVESVDKRCESNEHRIGTLEDSMKVLNDTQINLVRITTSVENMSKAMLDVNKKVDVIGEKQDKLTEKVTVLENKPANDIKRRFDGIWERLVLIFATGITTYLLCELLPNIKW